MTKSIPLTQGKFALVDDEDFEWLNQWKWFVIKDHNVFYAVRTQNHIKMHNVIMKPSDGFIVDHKDGDGLNNSKINLRICTTSQNQMNKRKPSNNTSGYKGVHFHKPSKKYLARICLNNKRIVIGFFKEPQDAARAYDQAAVKYFGEFAKTNF